jgi:hypothetical protein
MCCGELIRPALLWSCGVGACRKAKHPATNGLDLPYWLFIYPGEKLGFFYGVNHSGTNTRRRSSVPNMADLAALAKSEAVVKATAEHPKVA